MVLRRAGGAVPVLALFALAFILVSCRRSGDNPPPDVPPTPTVSAPTFAQTYSVLNQAGCLATGCHGSGNAPLMNTQAAAYANLVGITSNCGGKKYVVASDASASYLVEKISANPACGVRMPSNNPGYFDGNSGQLQLIRDWINSGAPNN